MQVIPDVIASLKIGENPGRTVIYVGAQCSNFVKERRSKTVKDLELLPA